MGLSTEVPDGATQRHSRMMELLTFTNLTEPRGATITQIQSHMVTIFSLTFKTTNAMIREPTLTSTIKANIHALSFATKYKATDS